MQIGWKMQYFKLFVVITLNFFGSFASGQTTLTEPKGPVILTITGNISATNNGGTAEFDLEMLESLPQRVTQTDTPWHENTTTFTGPTMSDLLSVIGATGNTLRITALNNYTIEVPVQDYINYPVIIATRADGNVMTIRQKGPLFVIYPFAEMPELYNEVYFGRSIWQMSEIEVLN